MQDRDAARWLWALRTCFPNVVKVWADGGCSGQLATWATTVLGLMVDIVSKLADQHVGPIQRWGVYSAGPAQQPGTKDGWSIEPDTGGEHWVTNAVGFAGPDERYAVAIMYQLPPGPGIDVGVHLVSDIVATVFGAPVPAPVTVPDPATGR